MKNILRKTKYYKRDFINKIFLAKKILKMSTYNL